MTLIKRYVHLLVLQSWVDTASGGLSVPKYIVSPEVVSSDSDKIYKKKLLNYPLKYLEIKNKKLRFQLLKAKLT